MRLHRLSLTAFGPFADTAEVDFDALATGGVFLLTGATGAGKTSVLDAVCFALYGQVPGDRANAKHLRSDHAPPDREPLVVLEVSVGARRFRFTRSPAWTRPKKRGSGTTTVPAHVVVEEQRAGTWVALTNRLEDAGLLVGDLLGMNCSQFTQVAMLPQGRFQAFLRASSAERHDVLQKLFRTDRFERVERWLVERRTEARRAAEAGEAAVRTVLTRLEESGAAVIPDEWSATLEAAGDEGWIQEWSDALATSVQDAVGVAEAEAAGAEAAERTAREELDAAAAKAGLLERARAAAADLAAYHAGAEHRARIDGRLARHRAAAPLATLVEQARSADAGARAAAAEAASTIEKARDGRGDAAIPADCDRAGLVAAQRRAARGLADASAFAPRQEELDRSLARMTAAKHELADLTAAAESTAAELATLPGALRVAEERRERTAAAAARLPDARARVLHLEDQVRTARRHGAAAEELRSARADLLTATERAQGLHARYLDVREARINGMAAELAGRLASGCSCPVCGSIEHPAPAHSTGTGAGRRQEQAARREHEDAVLVELGHREKVAGLEAEVHTLSARLDGRTRTDLATDLRSARTDLAAVEADAAAAKTAATLAAGARTALVDATERSQELGTRLVAAEATLTALVASVAALESERIALLSDEARDLPTLIASRQSRVTALESALAAHDAAAAARDAARAAVANLSEAARAAGFTATDHALDALLPAEKATELERELTTAEAVRLAAEAVLADPDVVAAREAPVPDLAASRAAHAETIRAARAAASTLSAARARVARVAELDHELAEALALWGPLRSRHRTVAELASLVEGRSADNPLRIRLASYVLAERLRQVVAAANERLAHMTGSRFSLEHVLDRGVGEQRGGLSLRVRDDWNGVERDPATLSGGETFVVSLALALGLADTVAHEAGGTDIDTLFIDEGFGSLDAETLEDVMDTLDGLRDGGRVVGLVSHVPELRSRVTTQLEVTKGRTGSTLRPVLAHG